MMHNHLNNKTTRACDFETRLTGGAESIDMFLEIYEWLDFVKSSDIFFPGTLCTVFVRTMCESEF